MLPCLCEIIQGIAYLNPYLSIDVFKRYLKTFFLLSINTTLYSALETLRLCAI